MNITDIEYLPQLIEKTLVELGMPGVQWSCVTSRVRSRRLPEAARAGIMVVWLAEQNVVEFHAEDGRLLRSLALDKDADREKAA
jgi:hypothetical protein